MSDRVGRHLAACAAVQPDAAAAAVVARRAAAALRPPGALAALDAVAVWLAGWQRRPDPRVERPAAVVFVADHGVARRVRRADARGGRHRRPVLDLVTTASETRLGDP